MKRAVIIVSLVEEAGVVASRDIEREIREELSKNPSVIPWAKEIQSVRVE